MSCCCEENKKKDKVAWLYLENYMPQKDWERCSYDVMSYYAVTITDMLKADRQVRKEADNGN